MTDLRIPPHSKEAEEAVIASLLLDNEALHRIHLPPEAFYGSFRREAYRAIRALAAAGHPFDTITVYERMKAAGHDQDGNAMPELAAMSLAASSASNVRRYAAIMADKHLRRQMIEAADQIAEQGYAEEKAATEALDAGQMALAKLATVRAKSEPEHIAQSMAPYLGLLQDMSEGKNPAIPTGIIGLDRLLNGGMRRGEMLVIGARPKHGKTALSLALARNMARDFGVLFISQEMPITQLMHRHTAAMGSVDLGRILAADKTDSDMWERVMDAAHRLGRLNLVHDQQAAQSLMDVRRKAVGVKRAHGLDVLFVDFLQLMQGAGEDNRNRELDVIANGLKALALDLDVGVVLMSQ
jgi:replicative DNA helicase